MLNFFKIETKKYSCIKREVGTTLLKIEIFYPFLETDAENNPKVERINQFYEEIVNNCKIYAKGPLFEKIRLEYENDTDEKKRFHFKKYHYKVNFEYSITEDKMLSVVLDSLLLRGSERIRYRRTALVWDVSLSHLLLPIHKKGNTIASPHGYYIKDGKEILYTHDGGYREEKFDINM